MLSINSHLKAASIINRYRLDNRLKLDFPVDEILNLGSLLEGYEDTEILIGLYYLQYAVAKDNTILQRMNLYREHLESLNKLMGLFQKDGHYLFDENDDFIQYILKNFNVDNYYFKNELRSIYLLLDYCKKYNITSPFVMDIIHENLKAYLSVNLEENLNTFTDEELHMLTQPYIAEYTVKKEGDIQRFCGALVDNVELKLYLKKLTQAGIQHQFTAKGIQQLQNMNLLRMLFSLLLRMQPNYYYKQLLDFWAQSEYNAMEIYRYHSLFYSNQEAAYDILCHKNKSPFVLKIYGMDFPELAEKAMELVPSSEHFRCIIDALSNGKKSFLRMVNQDFDFFKNISHNSLLFKVYEKWLNLNTLNADDYKSLANIRSTDRFVTRDLFEGYVYLAAELSALAIFADDELDKEEKSDDSKKVLVKFHKNYIYLYHKLECRLEKRLLVIRQLKNKKLLHGEDVTAKYMYSIARPLSHKDLHSWINSDFSHIKDLTSETALRLLPYTDRHMGLMQQAQNNAEATFIIDNADHPALLSIDCLSTLIDMSIQIHASWIEIADKLELEDAFIAEHRERIMSFCSSGAAYQCKTFINNSKVGSDASRDLLRLIKADLAGIFHLAKYNKGDLMKELQIPMPDELLDTWQTNTEINSDNIRLFEADDFFSTLNSGSWPYSTCISYDSDKHPEALISNFDTNKKIVFLSIEDEIVGRCIIRLTKGSFQDAKGKNEKLEFKTVEELNQQEEFQEELVLFMERPYFGGVKGRNMTPYLWKMISFVRQKADKMGVRLILSPEYNRVLENSPDYTNTQYSVFISFSKSVEQYLDSMGGAVTTQSKFRAGKYYRGEFYLLSEHAENPHTEGI